jgi:hypothetical protein
MSVKRGRGAAMGASSLDNSPNEQPRNHFQYQPLGYAENESWFYLQNGPTLISITDTGLGSHAVTENIKAVLRKIEYWHQGSITNFKIMCRDGKDFWHRVRRDGKTVSLLALQQTDSARSLPRSCSSKEN